MSLKHVPTDSSNDRQHRTVIATTVNELVKTRPPFDRTQAERAAGVTPLDTTYPPGDVRRYGASVNGSDDCTKAVQDAALSNDEIVFPPGFSFKFNADISRSVVVTAYGATLKPFATGEVLAFTGATTRISVYGGHLDLTGFTSTAGAYGDVGLFGDGIESLEVYGSRFTSGAFPIVADSCGLIRVDSCRIEDADQWGAYSIGCDDVIYTNNVVTGTVTFDGLKVAGTTGASALNSAGRIIITGNSSHDNTTDGMDIAINGALVVKIEGNVGSGNGERFIDFKVLDNDNGSDEVDTVSISNNTATTAVSGAVLINAQDSEGTLNIRSLTIANNNLLVDLTANSATGIRVADIDRAKVYDNKVFNALMGIRLRGCDDANVHNNSLVQVSTGVLIETSSDTSEVCDRARVHHNYIRPQGHNSGAGNAVKVDTGDGNQVYDNDLECGNSQYSVLYETNGATSATNTSIGRNRRGFATALPTGNRAAVGDYWEHGAITHGVADRWVCNTNTSSTTSTNLRAQGQVSYRTGSVAPSANANFVGEEFLDTTAGKWYKAKATGTGASDWVALN